MVYMLLAEGFEEIEVVAPLDILRRADVLVSTVSLSGDLLVRGGHDVVLQADVSLECVDFDALEMLVVPGGTGGVACIASSPAAMDLIRRSWSEGKLLAAICAAPSLLGRVSLLGDLNILDGRAVVCHPFVSDEVSAAGGVLQHGESVCRDGNLITGLAAGASVDFGLLLVAALRGEEVSEKLRGSIFYLKDSSSK